VPQIAGSGRATNSIERSPKLPRSMLSAARLSRMALSPLFRFPNSVLSAYPIPEVVSHIRWVAVEVKIEHIRK
jgi:hypothetical protein